MEAVRGGSLVRDLAARLHAQAPEADARQLSTAVLALSRLEYHPGEQVRGSGAPGTRCRHLLHSFGARMVSKA